MAIIEDGDLVEIKEARGKGKPWKWSGLKGRVIEVDEYCLRVRLHDGTDHRDLKEHFRIAR